MNWIGEILGYLAGLSTAFFCLPQTVKTLRSNDVRGLSACSYSIYVFGMVCWMLYGIYLNSIPMIVFNGISLVFAVTVLYKIIQQRGKK